MLVSGPDPIVTRTLFEVRGEYYRGVKHSDDRRVSLYEEPSACSPSQGSVANCERLCEVLPQGRLFPQHPGGKRPCVPTTQPVLKPGVSSAPGAQELRTTVPTITVPMGSGKSSSTREPDLSGNSDHPRTPESQRGWVAGGWGGWAAGSVGLRSPGRVTRLPSRRSLKTAVKSPPLTEE